MEEDKLNENRKHKITFRLSDEELAFMKEKMEISNCRSASTFIRKMVLSGAIYNVDTTELTEMRRLIGSFSNNINQIAVRANFQNRIYDEDIKEIKEKVNEIWQQQVSILSLLHQLGH